MRQKILALGHDDATSWVANSLVGRGIETVRFFEVPESLNVIKQDNYDMVVVDSAMPDVESVCFRIIWLCRLRVAVVSRDLEYDMQLLTPLGIDAFLPADSPQSEVISDIETICKRGPHKFDSVRVLAIEDDKHIREAIRLCFRIFWPEAELVFAEEGQSGVNIIKNKAMDLVMLDLGLPDISGFEVLNWIRNFSKVPVIVLTAAREQENVVRAIKAGANDYVVKPFKQMELMPRIRKNIAQYALIK
jgi:DNA-binding response OmpR family regulator